VSTGAWCHSGPRKLIRGAVSDVSREHPAEGDSGVRATRSVRGVVCVKVNVLVPNAAIIPAKVQEARQADAVGIPEKDPAELPGLPLFPRSVDQPSHVSIELVHPPSGPTHIYSTPPTVITLQRHIHIDSIA